MKYVYLVMFGLLCMAVINVAFADKNNARLPWPTTGVETCTSPYEYNQEQKTLTLWKRPKECENG